MYRNKRKHKLNKCSQHFFDICVDSLGVCLWSEHLARGGLCNGDGTWRGGKQYVNASDINNLTLRNLFHQNMFYRDWASGTNENRSYGMLTWCRGNLYGRWCLSAPLPSTYKRYQCVYFKIQSLDIFFEQNGKGVVVWDIFSGSNTREIHCGTFTCAFSVAPTLSNAYEGLYNVFVAFGVLFE